MKKILCFLIVTLFVFSVSSCSTNNASFLPESSFAQDSAQDDFWGSDSEIYEGGRAFPTYEQVQSDYPDKTILVWAAEYVRSVRVEEINKYLDNKGFDFAVCFKYINSSEYETGQLFPNAFAEYVKDMVNDGDQVDIISPMNYKDFVFNGLYIPLDEYFETEVGKELYDIMPQKHWESLRINGKVYGIHGTDAYSLSPDWGYFVNAELAEKYNFDILKPIGEQLDILDNVRKNEYGCDVFSMSKSRIEIPVLNAGIKEISFSIATVYWNGESHSAECLFDNPEYLEKLRLYETLKNEGCFVDSRKSRSPSFFIMQENVGGGSTVYNRSDRVKINYNEKNIDAIPVFKEPTYIRNCGVATGICSSSKNKEKAFELLALTQTDPVLNNLLTFGVEGEDYTLANDRIDTVITLSPINTILFANNMICYQYEDNAFTAEQFELIYENAKYYEDSEFVVNTEKISDELAAAEPLMNDFEFHAKHEGKELTLDETIALTREQLEEAGIQKIIDECNRQYGEYKNEKN